MHMLSIVLQVILAVVFLVTGGGKIARVKSQVEGFSHLGLPMWFLTVTGLVQVVGALGMIAGLWYPAWAVFAGLWVGGTMLGALVSHIRSKDSFRKALPAVVLGVMAFVVAGVNGL
ncbi:hypothetical protein SY83_02390 [Paenibacillus swuensis]|uniref:DoxX family protein n=1 Tax=Paenibacillus swuensis TaxID=1178515 RepID=A0A172TEN1_9BACL|nr:DoxX family protein [Paenibacillus swuensis]ANE45364.1 hypothetical protein SY83_02390 [Paenibacillus swuensis]